MIKEVAARSGLTQAEAKRVTNALLSVMQEHLEYGETVLTAPLGRFKLIQRAARKARNPQTGETVHVPEKTSVVFRASRKLKELVN